MCLISSRYAYDSDEHHLRAIIEIQNEQRAILRIVDEDDNKEIHREELFVQKEKNLHILKKY